MDVLVCSLKSVDFHRFSEILGSWRVPGASLGVPGRPGGDLGGSLGDPWGTLLASLGAKRGTAERILEKTHKTSKSVTPFWPKKGVPGTPRVPKWFPKVFIFHPKTRVEIRTRKRGVNWLGNV